jgi:hypothetical protein
MEIPNPFDEKYNDCKFDIDSQTHTYCNKHYEELAKIEEEMI